MFLEKYSCSLVNSIEVSNFCLFPPLCLLRYKVLLFVESPWWHWSGAITHIFSVTSCISCRHCIDLRTQMSVAPSSFCRSYNSFKDLFFVKRLDIQTHKHTHHPQHKHTNTLPDNIQNRHTHTHTHTHTFTETFICNVNTFIYKHTKKAHKEYNNYFLLILSHEW